MKVSMHVAHHSKSPLPSMECPTLTSPTLLPPWLYNAAIKPSLFTSRMFFFLSIECTYPCLFSSFSYYIIVFWDAMKTVVLFLRYTWSICEVDLTGFIPSRSPLRAHLGKLQTGTLQWRRGAGLHYSWWGWSVITVEGEARREGGCTFRNYAFKFTLKTEWRSSNHM